MQTQVSEVKLHYQSKVKPSARKKINTASDVYDIMKDIPEMAQNIEFKELFYVLYLNQANSVLSSLKISEGGTTSTTVDVRHIIQGAILQNATALILCHNHPSGKIKASEEDINLTWQIQNACMFFNIKLVDHVIISTENYFSFVNDGLL